MSELVDDAISISSVYQECAGALLRRARAQRGDGTLDATAYETVYLRYLSIMQAAITIVNEASHQESLGLAVDVKALDLATRELGKALASLATTQKILDVTAAVLVAAGSVAVAIVAPASLPAAVLAVGAATSTIVGAATS